jgi:hypothetical protein
VGEAYIQLLLYFIFFYPFAVSLLASIEIAPYDLHDPLLVATWGILAIFVVSLPVLLAYRMLQRSNEERVSFEDWIINILKPSRRSTIFLALSWILTLLAAGVISFIRNPIPINDALALSYHNNRTTSVPEVSAQNLPPTVTLLPISSTSPPTQSLAAITTEITPFLETATAHIALRESPSPKPATQPALINTFTVTVPPPDTSTPTHTQTAMVIASVSVISANLRSGPGVNFQIAGVAEQGDSYSVVAQVGEGEELWYLISQLNGQRAWIWSGAVAISPRGSQIQIAVTTPAPMP